MQLFADLESFIGGLPKDFGDAITFLLLRGEILENFVAELFLLGRTYKIKKIHRIV